VTIRNAKQLVFGLLLVGEGLNRRFIPEGLQYVSRLSSIFAVLYTPIFKRALVLKNAACAALIAMAVLFSGIIATPELRFGPRLSLLIAATNMIFLGSFSGEILMDIADEHGDKKNGLKTVPIVFGKDNAWNLAYISMFTNVLVNSIDIMRNFGIFPGIGFSILCTPVLSWLRDVRKYEYSVDAIREYGKKIVLPMGFALVYLQGLSKFLTII
jgi:4-hydroxybenzoate polyprenyltransferase